MKAVAFNYQSQQWETGETAIVTRAGQLAEELMILESSRGAEYARFLGVDRQTAIALIKTEQAALLEPEPKRIELFKSGGIWHCATMHEGRADSFPTGWPWMTPGETVKREIEASNPGAVVSIRATKTEHRTFSQKFTFPAVKAGGDK